MKSHTTLIVVATILLVGFAQTSVEEIGAMLRRAIVVEAEAEAKLESDTAAAARASRIADEARVTAKESFVYLDAARTARKRLEVAYQKALASKPPVPPDPPATGRPGEDLDWHVRPEPFVIDFDWIVENSVAVSQRGLGSVPAGPGVGLGTAYRASREAGDGDIVFAIADNAGEAWVGGQYNKVTWPSTKDLSWTGESKASATFVGITTTASVSLVFSSPNGRAVPTGDVLCFSIGVRGAGDGFIIRASTPVDHVQFDGCWWLPKADEPNKIYVSGMHIDGWDTLVIRNHKWRGEALGSPGIKFQEHPLAYLKSGTTSTIIELCDLYGGNRTGFQKRPQSDHNPLPTDRFMIRGNYCDGYGSNWDPGNPATSVGGAVYTVWVSAAGTYIYDNTATNFRYKALAVSGQVPDRNWSFLPSGNQHDKVYISGNRFVPGPITERGTVGVSATDYVRIYSDNHFEGRVALNSRTNNRYNGLTNVTQEIWVPEGEPAMTWDLWSYSAAVDREVKLTPEQIDAMLVRY